MKLLPRDLNHMAQMVRAGIHQFENGSYYLFYVTFYMGCLWANLMLSDGHHSDPPSGLPAAEAFKQIDFKAGRVRTMNPMTAHDIMKVERYAGSSGTEIEYELAGTGFAIPGAH